MGTKLDPDSHEDFMKWLEEHGACSWGLEKAKKHKATFRKAFFCAPRRYLMWILTYRIDEINKALLNAFNDFTWHSSVTASDMRAWCYKQGKKSHD